MGEGREWLKDAGLRRRLLVLGNASNSVHMYQRSALPKTGGDEGLDYFRRACQTVKYYGSGSLGEWTALTTIASGSK